ncbi:energy-coupling factor ABC transporter permease [Robbsia sp. KACC 23696]|uniref:energy-coupling factor ABC transporter permease n=1 Tax=Robbsia sp. KACC 23696 TaxID=3149231 RepID=UPI00325B0920
MGFLYSPLPLWASIGGWIVALVALASAVIRKTPFPIHSSSSKGWVGRIRASYSTPFAKLNTDGLQHLWLSCVVTLSVLWTFDIWVQDGAVFHLLGATLMVTLFGWALALIGTSVVILLVALILGTPVDGIGLTLIALSVVPVLISALVESVLARYFPNKRAPFVLGHGVLTPVLAVWASTSTVLLGHMGLLSVSWHWLDPSFVMMTSIQACGEAMFTAAMTAIIAVYKPAWMTTFDKRLNRIDQ